MSVAPPPRRPDIDHDRDLEQRVADLEALIEEARRRATAPPSHLRRARAFRARDRRLGGLRHRRQRRSLVGPAGSCRPVGGAGCTAERAAVAGAARPAGGDIFAIAVDPADSKIVYAGGWGNVFKSTDGGDSWKNLRSEPWTRVGVLAIDPTQPSVVYAGTDRGVGKSTDGGRHWRMVNSGLFEGRAALRPRVASLDESAVWSLTIDAQHPSTVYATTALGLYRTTNGGKRWQVIGRPVSETLSARNARSSARATNWPSRSTRTTLRPSTRAGRASVFRRGSTGAATVGRAGGGSR